MVDFQKCSAGEGTSYHLTYYQQLVRRELNFFLYITIILRLRIQKNTKKFYCLYISKKIKNNCSTILNYFDIYGGGVGVKYPTINS